MERLSALFVLLILAVGGVVFFANQGGIFPTKRIHYRYEVTVDTPQGLMTGYSVHRIVIQDTTMTPARNYQVELDGEAVPFELSDGRILLATLSSESGAGPQRVFGTTVRLSGTGKWIDAPQEFDKSVSKEHFPKLAIIDDPEDPKTLRLVSTGSGFEVLSVRMISTDEAMTETVAELLPWLVETIQNAPYSSSQMTNLHLIAFTLKVGVRS